MYSERLTSARLLMRIMTMMNVSKYSRLEVLVLDKDEVNVAPVEPGAADPRPGSGDAADPRPVERVPARLAAGRAALGTTLVRILDVDDCNFVDMRRLRRQAPTLVRVGRRAVHFVIFVVDVVAIAIFVVVASVAVIFVIVVVVVAIFVVVAGVAVIFVIVVVVVAIFVVVFVVVVTFVVVVVVVVIFVVVVVVVVVERRSVEVAEPQRRLAVVVAAADAELGVTSLLAPHPVVVVDVTVRLGDVIRGDVIRVLVALVAAAVALQTTITRPSNLAGPSITSSPLSSLHRHALMSKFH